MIKPASSKILDHQKYRDVADPAAKSAGTADLCSGDVMVTDSIQTMSLTHQLSVSSKSDIEYCSQNKSVISKADPVSVSSYLRTKHPLVHNILLQQHPVTKVLNLNPLYGQHFSINLGSYLAYQSGPLHKNSLLSPSPVQQTVTPHWKAQRFNLAVGSLGKSIQSKGN